MKLKTNLFVFTLVLAFSVTLAWADATPKVIQTQYGPNGGEADLVSAKVGGKVLSVALVVRNAGDKRVFLYINPAEVNYIDNKESKKYQVLKDENGEWLAGPIGDRSDEYTTVIRLDRKDDRMVVWYKFPAPPEDVASIQINVPGISPFDGVEITR